MTAQETVVSRQRPTASLTIQEGSQAGTTFPLSEEPVIIGREPGVEILLDDEECSRRHAQVSWQVQQFIIADMGSTNGTFVNGSQTTAPHMLRPDDQIRVGQTTLVFQATEAPVAPAAEEVILAGDMIPSRHALTTAEETNQRLGHENLGFLSESHGVMPVTPPLLRLPPAHQAWDEMAERLPELFLTLELRRAFDDIPVLSADSEDLPDPFLLRASVLLSMFAHSYYRVEHNQPQALPESIQRPWERVTQRLGRPAPHLSYIDLIIYNWRIVDATLPDPMRVENMRLLAPTVDNKEERIFYLTQVEILAQCTPLISAVVRAQEAAQRDEVDALEEELIHITDALHSVTRDSFMKISPNSYSDSHVDPVVWAKTVAPFAVPIQEGTAGPSGTAAPIFHILDTFFGRLQYDSRFGDEMIHLREWYPKHWQDFLKALAQISVSDFIEKTRSKTLKGLLTEATQAYVGDSGFLTRHRLKVHGYLDIGFKVGRSVTITGFTGLFKDRTWEQVDTELESARTERHAGFRKPSHYADVMKVITTRAESDEWVKQVVLDVSRTGIRYRPGDRCGILPENSDALVERTLRALRARGNEPIRLDAAWREAIALREGYEEAATLPLRTLLTFGRIRPVDRPVAKALYAVSHNETLRRIVEARAEDQWELWDLLEMVAEAGFDPKRLWKAHPGERESIGRIVPPASFRMYSISSASGNGPLDETSELHLTIGRLRYQTKISDVSPNAERLGTASNFLGDTSAISPEDMGRISLRMVRPPRFSLPQDESAPVVMFAGGTGLAPFRGFIHERARQSDAAENWLFFGTRTSKDFYYQEELEEIAAQGLLDVRVAFSQEDSNAEFVSNGEGGHFVFKPGTRHYIGDDMLQEETASALWDLVRSKQEGGKGGYFYVCGRTGFATAVMDAIEEVIRRNGDKSGPGAEANVHAQLYRLVGEGRYMQEVFTTYPGPHFEQRKTYDASEVVLHNNEQDGYWMIIDGRVYDLTEFAHLHHGGFKIISGYAGIDATRAYQNVLHDVNSEVDATRGMYELGAVRRLDFGTNWGIAIGSSGLRFLSLGDVYRVWVRFLYTIVEIENAVKNDFSIKGEALTWDDSPNSPSGLRTQMLIEVHNRFMLSYLESTMGETLENLWAVTSGLCSQNEDVRWVRQSVEAIQQSEPAQRVKQLGDKLVDELATQKDADPDGQWLTRLAAYCEVLEIEDTRFVREMKQALLEGVKVFEELERETIYQGSDRLLNACRAIPRVLEAYYARVISGVQALDGSSPGG